MGTSSDDKLCELIEVALLALGYKEANEESHTIGVLFAYETEFSTNKP